MISKEVGMLLTVVMLALTFDCGNCNRQQIEKVVSFKSNAVTRVEDSEIARHRDSRSVHRSQRSVLSSVDIQTAVDTHNNCRRLVGAADVEIMVSPNEKKHRPEYITLLSRYKCALFNY